MIITFSANARLHKSARVHSARTELTLAAIIERGIGTLNASPNPLVLIDGVSNRYPGKEPRKNVTVEIDDDYVTAACTMGLHFDKDIRVIYSAALYWGTKGGSDA